jgi:hypothetical protein
VLCFKLDKVQFTLMNFHMSVLLIHFNRCVFELMNGFCLDLPMLVPINSILHGCFIPFVLFAMERDGSFSIIDCVHVSISLSDTYRFEKISDFRPFSVIGA